MATRILALTVLFSAIFPVPVSAEPQTCVIVYSKGTLAHEMAHCWGWEHPEDDPRYIKPPRAFTALGRYPDVLFPCGQPCTVSEARRLCTGHDGCQWFQ